MNTSFRNLLNAALEPSELIESANAESMLVDERNQYRGSALAIAAPKSVASLSRLMRLCHQHQIAVVPQGGNTGYCGGATPDASGRQVLLSLRHLNQCRDVDVVGRTITVEAGMVLQDVQQLANENGLLFPLSMGSEGSCQIGGNLSTNAGGLAVLRYGTARDLVLGLEVVLPNGEVLDELKALRKDTTGYDLKQLFIGAEGTLGVITAASLKLYPKPKTHMVAWLALPDAHSFAPLLVFLQAELGDAVSSFEYISRRSLEYVLENCDGHRDPMDERFEHYALVEFGGFGTQETFNLLCESALAKANVENMLLDAVIAASDVQARALWALRESIPRAEKLLGGSIKHDVSAPVSRMGELVIRLEDAITGLDETARLSIYGHVGDGNVHFNVLPPEHVDYASYKHSHGTQISRLVHDIAAEYIGSFSAEHGVGQLKIAELERYAGPLQLNMMRAIKQALDPDNIMNPGKVLQQ